MFTLKPKLEMRAISNYNTRFSASQPMNKNQCRCASHVKTEPQSLSTSQGMSEPHNYGTSHSAVESHCKRASYVIHP